MDSKIKELTDKIYHEGVEKGNQEAAQILAKAKQQSDEMVATAQAEAQRIVNDAQRQAADLTKNTQAELKLYAEQVVSSTQSTIADSLTDRIVRDNVKAMTTDADFMQKLMLTIVQQWTVGEPMVIETANAEALEKYMLGNAKALLDSDPHGIVSGSWLFCSTCRWLVQGQLR